jgi:signal transduction histidine kinase
MSSLASKQSQNPDSFTNRQQSNTSTVALLQRVPFFITAMVGAAGVVLLVIYLVTAIEWRQKPFFGAMLNPYMVVDGSRPISSSGWNGLKVGLQRLDQIITINGQTIVPDSKDYNAARANFLGTLDKLQVGDSVEVTFERPETSGAAPAEYCAPAQNGFSNCTLSFTLTNLPDSDFIAYFVIPFIGGLIIVLLGIVVAYLRPQQSPALMVAIFSITFGIFMAGLFDINNTYVALLPWLLATTLMGSALGTFAFIFPVAMTIVYRHQWIKWLPLAINIPLVIFGVIIYFNPPTPNSFADAWQPGLFFAVLMLIVLAINLVQRRATAISTAVRDQTNSVLIGLALATVPLAIWIVDEILRNTLNTPFFNINTSATMPFFIMPSIAMAYAVLQYRRINTDQAISQGITYSIMLVALVVGYFLVVFGASLVANQALALQGNQFVIALTIFILSISFLPVRNLLQERINRIYFRKRTNFQERVENFATELAGLETLDQLINAYRTELNQSISPSNTFVFLPDRQLGEFTAYGKPKPETDVRFEASSSLLAVLDKNEQVYLESTRVWQPELLVEKSRLGILKTVVLARLRGRKELIGFVSIGQPRIEKGRYGFEELRFIQNLTGQLAIAVERAQVVESLERRVRELDVLSQVSQAVNFTIEFDDLLELIYAQTDRLISAPYFYIALRERGGNRLFFAFFLENEERYADRENRRWLMGRDLFSEVVNSAKPLRVEDYAAEMEKRGSKIIYESHDLKGWMGVPLEAGSETLGVLAVGSTQSGKKYTDDQLRVFSDIGTLAATSLEKARLFAETDLRARQLSALNEISQKLATELNVENLLELITQSAANILNAEAGSLLLTDENSDSLEFKVATGASGKALIGRRFPKNKGLAGEVATTGKTIIVNDAANDPRWGGEATGAFSTSAVLAVPLIAQNKVVGVLEILNKKDGGLYLQEDANLLTTFAGQAAVAIENARLFQMTDLQLGQRVSELQALERIDVELNRSLDLQKVADITMRYAISNSSATAGVLGLVVGGDNPHLEIIAMAGYEADDYPKGAEGLLWPIDGVVKRVMRTRQPDLVTDTKIDPNYTPSLRGSLSQLTIPMLAGGEINAMLVLEKDKEPRLSLVDMAFAQRLAEHASIAITNAQINAELTRANESKSEFVSFVAHELKTPMTSMKGFADLLVTGMVGDLNENQKNFLNTIRSNIDRMNTLVSDLNDVTKLQTNNLNVDLAPVDFRDIVNETLRPLTRQIEEKEQLLTLKLPERLPKILADQNRMIQVLTNMVSNAWKYSPEHTEIIISADVRTVNMDSKGRDQGPALHIMVKDSGIGMSPEDLAKLFTAYFRSENPLTRLQPGTGLGLTITRGIIQQHKGEVWVESELGKGTAFHFTIPIAVEKQPAAQPEMQPAK